MSTKKTPGQENPFPQRRNICYTQREMLFGNLKSVRKDEQVSGFLGVLGKLFGVKLDARMAI